MVKEKGVARSANARANKVNGQYLTKARKLDTECFSSEPDVEARPVLRRLRSYPGVRGQCVGALGVQFGHPSAATRGGQVRCHTLYATGGKLEPFLWRRRSRSTRLGTAAIGVLN